MKSGCPRILAYLLSVHSDGTFGKVFCESQTLYQTEYPVYLKHTFMLGAFVIVATLDLYPYMIRRLPNAFLFLYEFLVSLFIFDVVCFTIWYPIVYALYVTLPEATMSLIDPNECCCFQALCSRDRWPFTVLLHIVSLLFLFCVFYSFGIISISRKNGGSKCITSRWLLQLRRIHHGIMCTEDKLIEECNRCQKLFDETYDRKNT